MCLISILVEEGIVGCHISTGTGTETETEYCKTQDLFSHKISYVNLMKKSAVSRKRKVMSDVQGKS